MNQKTVLKTSIFIFLVSLTATSYGGMSRNEAMKLKPKSDNDALFFPQRIDSALVSLGDKVVFYLNDVKVVELSPGTTAVPLHLRPGKYNARYEIYNRNGEQKKRFEFLAELQAGKVYESYVRYTFMWICLKISVMKKSFFFLDMKFLEEMDLRNKIKPL